ncbi:MAG TPA: FixH family protein [Kofleriaceae bacterium]|nr:FixH family protein [Kofleriaceae bacterium]
MKARNKWLIAIGGLLAGNVIGVTTLAVVANAGPAQIIPDYDVKAVRFDSELTRDAASRRLGWQAQLALTGETLEARLRDAAGQPIEGARVEITGYHRAHAAATLDVVLAPSGDGYRGALRSQRGTYDLTVVVDARGEHFTQHVAVEAP